MVLQINNQAFLINEQSSFCEKRIEQILKNFPLDAEVFVRPSTSKELQPKTVNELINKK